MDVPTNPPDTGDLTSFKGENIEGESIEFNAWRLSLRAGTGHNSVATGAESLLDNDSNDNGSPAPVDGLFGESSSLACGEPLAEAVLQLIR